MVDQGGRMIRGQSCGWKGAKAAKDQGATGSSISTRYTLHGTITYPTGKGKSSTQTCQTGGDMSM